MELSEEELRRRIKHFIVDLRKSSRPQRADQVADRLVLCLEGEVREPPFSWNSEQKEAFKIGDTAVVFLDTEPPWYEHRLTVARIQPDCGGTTLHLFDQYSAAGKDKVVGSVGWSRIDPQSVHSLDPDDVFDTDEPGESEAEPGSNG
jgi:hypothetical protein